MYTKNAYAVDTETMSDETRLKLLFLRLAGEHGELYPLSIDNNLRRAWGWKQTIAREPVRTTVSVDITGVTFVDVSSETCVRIGFGERLMTASGDNAKRLLAWARECCAGKAKQRPMPALPRSVGFDFSTFNVHVKDGELVFA